jgi:Mn-dependent DtxR family transcriptional regulator
VQGDRRRLELALDCPLVQRLDVAQHVLELEAARVDPLRGQRPEHERVVWIGAVSKPDQHAATLTALLWNAVARPALTDSIQDYLKAIYKLQEGEARVSVTALAREQGVATGSASEMVKKLAALELVDHAPYKGVRLTAAGERVAVEVIRHHRLLELYLAQTLGLDVEDVHDEADRLEHVLSEELEARIDRALGFPTHDPHGDPIPNAELEWPKSKTG